MNNYNMCCHQVIRDNHILMKPYYRRMLLEKSALIVIQMKFII